MFVVELGFVMNVARWRCLDEMSRLKIVGRWKDGESVV
jgi:hypothetical protein